MELRVNGQLKQLPEHASDPAMPLLWVLRDGLQLTGTKFGCGVAACGACTASSASVAPCENPASATRSQLSSKCPAQA